MTQEEIINKYPILSPEDFGTYTDGKRDFVIIEETGREKLMENLDISYQLSLEHLQYDLSTKERFVVIKASSIGRKRDVQTFGEVTNDTSDWEYFVNVAEKRALDRLVRKIAGLVGNILGRDELKSFTVTKQEMQSGEHKSNVQNVIEGLIANKERKNRATKKLPE